MKKAFTLAEIMIVMVVIGILSAILLPNAFKSTPDKNVLKFKKAHANFYKVIKELVSSGQYYTPGDMGLKPNGTSVTDTKYFCQTMADILNAKIVDCDTQYGTERTYADGRVNSTTDKTPTLAHIKTTANVNVDAKCAKVQSETIKADKQIVTADGIVWFEETTKVPYGFIWTGSTRLYGGSYPDSNGFDAIYKVYCIDVDGYAGPEAPFGYAVRADGLIQTGARADEWIKKSVQQKD